MIAGGCKSKKSSLDAVEDAAVSISLKDFGEIGDLLKVPSREVGLSEAERALKAAGLWEKDAMVSWDKRSGDKGTYEFKNLSLIPDEGEALNVKTLTLAGLHMVDDTPVVDLMTLSGVSVESDEFSLSVKNMGLTGVILTDQLSTIEDIAELETTSIVISDAEFSGEDSQGDIEIKITNLGWGKDPKDNYLRAAAKDISVKATGDEPIIMELASANIRGLTPVKGEDSTDILDFKNPDGFIGLLGQNQQIGDAEINGFEVDMDFFSINLPKLVQTSNEKKGVKYVDFDMPALTLSLQEEAAPARAKQGIDIIQTLGFDEMVFSSKGQTEIDTTADLMTMKSINLDLKDGFDLNYAGAIEGLGAMQQLSLDAPHAEVEAAQAKIKIHNFSMSLEDKSIVERGFNLAGKMTGQTPKNLRRQANGMLALGSLAALTQNDGAIYSQFAKALGEFIDDGGTLNVALKPQTPLSINDFESLSRGQKPDLNRLGFSASTTK